MADEKFKDLIMSTPVFDLIRDAATGRLTLKATLDLPRAQKPDDPRGLLVILHDTVQGCFGSDIRIHIESDPEILGNRPPFAKMELDFVAGAEVEAVKEESVKARMKGIIGMIHLTAAALMAFDLTVAKSFEMIADLRKILTKRAEKKGDADRSQSVEPDSNQTLIVDSDDDPRWDSEDGDSIEFRPTLKRMKLERSE